MTIIEKEICNARAKQTLARRKYWGTRLVDLVQKPSLRNAPVADLPILGSSIPSTSPYMQ